ncbi:polyphosphate kinase 2 family protein [Endothiovibrio diazotrophicus]
MAVRGHTKKSYKKLLKAQVAELSELQELHYASNRCAVRLMFQAMDAAGKDGAIRHVMSGVNPQGCEVYSFKHPSAEELEHDFLWRTSQCLPERGRIGIFNRFYYEELLSIRRQLEEDDPLGIGSGCDAPRRNRLPWTLCVLRGAAVAAPGAADAERPRGAQVPG